MKHSYCMCGVAILSAASFLVSCQSSTAPTTNNDNNNNNGGTYKASGTISLVVHSGGSGTLDQGNGFVNTKTDVSRSSLVISCGQVSASGGDKSFQWQDATLSGSASEAMYEVAKYPCTNGDGTNYDTTIHSFNSSNDGIQPAGAQLIVNGNTYGITATGAWTGQPMHVYTSELDGCGSGQFTSHEGMAISVPFEAYFSPFFGGAQGSLAGTIDPANPNQITGTLHGTVPITLYTNGNNSITTPLDVVISWSFTLTQ
ncbi:MAG: hypothetical protein JSS75_01075 [Bacteroidetes bacterium]|nr:hypothetical protein [Bacteroidota bacterium]